ncbi:hypothetical protein PXH59_00465 (plasmid) [Xenorhabdus sp. SF857]|uniref:hypothetical protein n=1 Tax=Xenorhabdus bakwenae TaxID=3026967 RepID=UPI002557D2D5|nr:hypothetical protein [Xenorhabdus sp. SF857]WFQ78152.1 hypothetical protein PXH59_00465 [Xenorhabdus sp. SF857]
MFSMKKGNEINTEQIRNMIIDDLIGYLKCTAQPNNNAIKVIEAIEEFKRIDHQTLERFRKLEESRWKDS